MAPTPAPPLRVLLAGAIDYAGLFPPAALSMADAVREFVACRGGPDRWALGRFVVPAGQLDELRDVARAAGGLAPAGMAPAGLSVLSGPDIHAALATIGHQQEPLRGVGAVVEAIECRAVTPDGAAEAIRLVTPQYECWVEIPLDAPAAPWLDAVQAAGGYPKIRTGGTSAGTFPEPRHLVAFLVQVGIRRLPFKATAGLHHALRGRYPYTYAADSDAGPMYGYLNLFLASALLEAGGSGPEAQDLLLEERPAAFRITEDGIAWRAHTFGLAALQQLRRDGLRAFGSCSFREPLAELPSLERP